MGKYVDFIVEEPENREELGPIILNRLLKARLHAGKQIFVFIAGAETTGTGEGKSYFALRWIDHFLTSRGVDFKDYLDDIVVFTPLEYAKKVRAILFDKRLKKIPVIMIDEASEVISANTWQSFINQGIRYINIMSRGIKPLVVFFISPDISDMEKRSRKMITFYCECARPLSGSTRVVIERPYKIRRGLEDVFIDTRTITGTIVGKKRNYRLYPKFTIKLPRKEISDPYDKIQKERKSKLAGAKIDSVLRELEKEYGEKFDRVDIIVQQFVQKPEMSPLFFKWKKSRKTKKLELELQPNFKKSFDLTNSEEKEFVKRYTSIHKKNMELENKKQGGIDNGSIQSIPEDDVL